MLGGGGQSDSWAQDAQARDIMAQGPVGWKVVGRPQVRGRSTARAGAKGIAGRQAGSRQSRHPPV